MLLELAKCDSALWILAQEFLQQGDAWGAQVGGEVRGLVDDLLFDFGGGVATKGGLSTNHVVQNHTHGPNIYGGGVDFLPFG